MSQAKELIDLFEKNGGRLTLGQILGAWEVVGSKYTNRLSEIRKMGYEVDCQQNRDTPTENVYTLRKVVATIYKEPSGQLAMVLK